MFGYYFVLALTIVSTALFLDRSGLAASIMSRSRSRSSSIYHGIPGTENKSSIRITASDDLSIIVINPQGLMSGESADGLLFQQIPGSQISQNKPNRISQIVSNRERYDWGIVFTQPIPGKYSFLLSAKFPGTYTFAVHIADANGLERKSFQELIVLTPEKNQHYTFDYYPQDPVNQSQFNLNPYAP